MVEQDWLKFFSDLDGGTGLVEIFSEISMVEQDWLKIFSKNSEIEDTGWKFS